MTEYIPGFSLYNENLGEITSDDLGIIMGKVTMPIAPSISAQMEDVPALYGQKFEGTNYGTKQIVIPFTWIAESTDYEQNRSDFYSTIRSLSQTFVRPYDGTMELALQFDEDPEITYWGHITEVGTPTEIVQGDYSFSSSITFEMSDPRGVMPRVTQKIEPYAIDTENTNFAYDTSNAKFITDKNLNLLYKLDDSIAHKGDNLWLSFDWNNQKATTTNEIRVGGVSIDLIPNLDQQLVMGFGIPNTTWDGTNACLTLPITSAGGEVVPQDGTAFISGHVSWEGSYNWEAGKTYTQSIIIETDAQINTNVQPKWTWYTRWGHNTQPAELVNLGNHCYGLIGSYTPNSDNAKNPLRIFDIWNFTSFVNVATGTYLKFRSPHFFCADDNSLSQLKLKAGERNPDRDVTSPKDWFAFEGFNNRVNDWRYLINYSLDTLKAGDKVTFGITIKNEGVTSGTMAFQQYGDVSGWNRDYSSISSPTNVTDYVPNGAEKALTYTTTITDDMLNGNTSYNIGFRTDNIPAGGALSFRNAFIKKENRFTIYRIVKYTRDSGRSDDRQVMATDKFFNEPNKTSEGTGAHYSGAVHLTPISSDIPSSQMAGVYAYIQVADPTNFSVEHFHLHSGSSETAYSGVTNLVNKHQITTTISVDGTAQTEPELSIIPNADQYYLGYTLNDDGYMGVGADESQTIDAADGTTVTPAREVVTSDGCGSLANWTTDQNVVNSLRTGLKKNTVQGEFQSNQDASAIIVGSYQDGLTPPHSKTPSSMDDDNVNVPNETWYGPIAVYQGVTSALDNFEISTILHHEVYRDSGSVHNTRAVGAISLLLLDENNVAWGEFSLKGSAVNGYGGTAPFARIRFTQKGGNFGTQATVGNRDTHEHYQAFSTYTKGKKTPLLAGVKWNAKGRSSTYKVEYGTTTKKETKITKKKAYKTIRVKNGKTKRGKQKYKTIRKAYTKTSKKTYKKTIQKYLKERDANTLLSSDIALQFWLRKYKNRFWYKVVQLSTNSYRPLRKGALKQNNVWIEITDRAFLSWAKNYKLGNVALIENKYPLEEDHARVVQKKSDKKIPANEKYKDAYLALVDLQITKLNYLENVDGNQNKPKEVVKKGQDVIFDSESEEITVENSMVEPVWISNYPKLKPGINTISIFGSNLKNAEIVLSYYPRTL